MVSDFQGKESAGREMGVLSSFTSSARDFRPGGEASSLTRPSVSQCSAECGAGVRTRSVVCMTNHVGSLPLEGCGSNRPADATPCDNGPCTGKVEWFAGSWSQVSGQSRRGSVPGGKPHSRGVRKQGSVSPRDAEFESQLCYM